MTHLIASLVSALVIAPIAFCLGFRMTRGYFPLPFRRRR